MRRINELPVYKQAGARAQTKRAPDWLASLLFWAVILVIVGVLMWVTT